MSGVAKKLQDLRVAPEQIALLFDLNFINHKFGLKFKDIPAAIGAYFSADDDAKFDPSPYFSRDLYRQINQNVPWGQEDPLEHYLKIGRFEGRKPHPLFHVRLVHEQNQQISREDIYFAFLRGDTTGQFHELIHPNYVTAQAADLDAPVRIFAEFADPSVPLRLVPHPLFDAGLYRHFAATRLAANELVDFLLHPRDCAITSPFFDPVYYVQTARLGQLEVPPLLHYLRNWHVWRGDVSLFVDVKFLNHQIDTALKGAKPESIGEPLSFALMHYLGANRPLLHSQIDPGAVARAFSNLLVNDPVRRVPEAAQAAAVFKHFLQDQPRLRPALPPLVSVVILNYFKPVYTCLSIFSVLNAFPDNDVEVIIVENGGELIHFEILKRNFSKYENVKFVKMKFNKFFGEGNNIAVDQAQGRYVLYLNNDCFLSHDYGEKLKSFVKAHPDVHAIGALMLFPDGIVQEFGGVVSDCGQVIQRAKGLPVEHLARRGEPEVVDYASAACLVVSRTALQTVGGFDPAFEPFYYEDTDFCRRLRAAGLQVYVNPAMTATHIENGTSRETLGERKFYSMIREHQALFARRWLKNRGGGVYLRPSSPVSPPPARRREQKTALIYTPFDLRTGGGERYILSAARALSRDYRVVLCSEELFSRARVLFTLTALGIPEFEFEISPNFEEIRSLARDIAVSFVMGNEIVPPIPPVADVNIFHLQFPFPWRNVGSWSFKRLELYDSIVVNSEFTAKWTRRRLDEVGAKSPPPIAILNPPVRSVGQGSAPAPSSRGKLHLVTVGRFFVGGHSKRHDIFLQIVKAARQKTDTAITATIIGGVHPEDSAREVYGSICTEAEAMGGVEVIVDASQDEMATALARADVYVHSTGYGVLEEVSPESMEHFGMSIIEALQADCIPIVVGVGGPLEIVEKAKCGFSFRSIEEAAELIQRLTDPGARRSALEARDRTWIEGLLEPAFDRNLHRIVRGLAVSSSAASDAPANGLHQPSSKAEHRQPAKRAAPSRTGSSDDIVGFAAAAALRSRGGARVI